MNNNMVAELINGLYDIHIELWDIVDMKKSDDDKIVAIAARTNNRLVKLRSDLVEKIDETIIRAINAQRKELEMNESIGDIIGQLGFEKIRMHEQNKETGQTDEFTQECNILKEKLETALNAVLLNRTVL